jgi:phage terminase large subunit
VRIASTKGLRIVCAREFQNSIADSVHALLSDTINRLGMQSWFDVGKSEIHSKAGAKIIFKGLRKGSEQDIKSLEGADLIWVEEGQSVSEDSWRTLTPTIRKRGSQIWVTMNAIDMQMAAWKRFVIEENRPARCIVHQLNYDSNPHLTPELEEERIWCMKTDPEAYGWIWLGIPKAHSDTLVIADKVRLDTFSYNINQEVRPTLLFGADFGYSQDPSTLIRCYIEDRKLWIDYEAWGRKIEVNSYRPFYEKVPGSEYGRIMADNSRPETISAIYNEGYNIHAAEKWPGSVEDGVAHLRGFEEIVIHERCKKTYEEALLWQFKADPHTGAVTSVLKPGNDHCWDAVRYALDGYILRGGQANMWARLGAT